MNILFEYMCRDEDNYKNFQTVIFPNPENITVKEAREKMELDKFTFFIPVDCDIAVLGWDDKTELDYWHEWIEIIETEKEATEDQNISQFIEKYEGIN